MSEPLSLQIEESVALMTFDRPARLNALNNALIDGIMHTLDRVEFDPGVRVVVITGTGRAFSAGAPSARAQTSPSFAGTSRPVPSRRSRISCGPVIA